MDFKIVAITVRGPGISLPVGRYLLITALKMLRRGVRRGKVFMDDLVEGEVQTEFEEVSLHTFRGTKFHAAIQQSKHTKPTEIEFLVRDVEEVADEDLEEINLMMAKFVRPKGKPHSPKFSDN